MVSLFPLGAVLIEQVTETFNEILNFGASQEALILRSDQKMMQVKPLTLRVYLDPKSKLHRYMINL